MASIVDIYNQALASAGTRSSIADTAEASKEAQACNLFYDSVRKSALRAAHWNFARLVTSLGLLKALPGTPENTAAPAATWQTSYPSPPWNYSYARPSDCVFVRRILWQVATNGYFPVPLMSNTVNSYNGVTLPVRYELGTDRDVNGNNINVVLTNAPSALIEYTQDIIDPLLWDPLFETVVVNALAAAVIPQLNGDIKRKRELMSDANDSIVQARISNGNEEIFVQDIPPESLLARGNYGIDIRLGVAGFGPLLRL